MIPLGRGGTPEEAAGAVYLFCIPESNYVSGQTIVCGGGFMMCAWPSRAADRQTARGRAPWTRTNRTGLTRTSSRCSATPCAGSVETELVPHETRWREQQHVDREVWRKAGAMGSCCATSPKSTAARAPTFAHEAVVYEELAARQRHELRQARAQHRRALRRCLRQRGRRSSAGCRGWRRGELIAAIAMSEPGAGSDLQGVRTRAVRDGDAYVINGSKTFITNGYMADLVLRGREDRPGSRAPRASRC